MNDISALRSEFYNNQINNSQYQLFMLLAAEYNQSIIREGNLTVNDYIANGIETTSFEEKQDSVGDYQVNFHTGIDIIGGDLKSPFFLISIGGKFQGSNDKIFSITGTDLRMRIKHGDAYSVKQTGSLFSPGDVIMPFPQNNNFDKASTGPHFHIDISDGTNFVSPYTLLKSNKIFKQTHNGGKTWKDVNVSF